MFVLFQRNLYKFLKYKIKHLLNLFNNYFIIREAILIYLQNLIKDSYLIKLHCLIVFIYLVEYNLFIKKFLF